jgi:hypothetical protein
MWCLLKKYLHENKDDPSGPFIIRDDDDYPLQFTQDNGPVPIRIATDALWKSDSFAREVGYRTGTADSSCGKGDNYVWTDDQYRYAILALRAVSPVYQSG